MLTRSNKAASVLDTFTGNVNDEWQDFIIDETDRNHPMFETKLVFNDGQKNNIEIKKQLIHIFQVLRKGPKIKNAVLAGYFENPKAKITPTIFNDSFRLKSGKEELYKFLIEFKHSLRLGKTLYWDSPPPRINYTVNLIGGVKLTATALEILRLDINNVFTWNSINIIDTALGQVVENPLENIIMNEYLDEKHTTNIGEKHREIKKLSQSDKDFSKYINKDISKIVTGDDSCDDEKLKKHQLVIKNFFTPYGPLQKLLVVHKTGSGKTRSIISILENYYYHSMPKLVILPQDTTRAAFYRELGNLNIQMAKDINEHLSTKKFKMDTVTDNQFTNGEKRLDPVNRFFMNPGSTQMGQPGMIRNQSENKRGGSILVFTLQELYQAIENLKQKRVALGFTPFVNIDSFKFTVSNSLVIMDEAHLLFNNENCVDEKYKCIYEGFKNAKNIALFTATPIRLNEMSTSKEIIDSFKKSYIPILQCNEKTLGNYLSVYDGGEPLFKKQQISKHIVQSEYYSNWRKNETVLKDIMWYNNMLHYDWDSKMDNLLNIIPMTDGATMTDEFFSPAEKQMFVASEFSKYEKISPRQLKMQLGNNLDFYKEYYPLGTGIIQDIKQANGRIVIICDGNSGLIYLMELLKEKNIEFMTIGVPDSFRDKTKFTCKDAVVNFQKGPPPTDFEILKYHEQNRAPECRVLIFFGDKPEAINIFGVENIFIISVYKSSALYIQAIGRINRMCDKLLKDNNSTKNIILYCMSGPQQTEFDKVYEDIKLEIALQNFFKDISFDNQNGSKNVPLTTFVEEL